MQRFARASEELRAARKVDRVVRVAAIGRATTHRDQFPVPELAEVIRDEALRLTEHGGQLAHGAVAACELPEQPPADRVPRELQERRRRVEGLCFCRTGHDGRLRRLSR
jgi:hypothetical protein